MALQKQPISINFSQGLDLKSDPKQVQPGKFLRLENTIFEKGGLLQKRNGYAELTQLPNTSSNLVTTFNGNLTAVGPTLQAYSSGSKTWVNRGNFNPATLTTLPLIRSTTNQIQLDTAISINGLVCTVFTDRVPSGGSNVSIYKYAIADVTTGQNIVAPTVITPSSGTIPNTAGGPKVFFLGNYFVIVFTNLISSTNHLKYIAINQNTPTVAATDVDITAQYTPATTVNFDGVVANNSLYLAWNGSDGGGAIRMTSIDSTLTQHGTVVFAGRVATIMSVSADTSASTPVIWASFWDSAGSTGYTLAVNQNLSTILTPTQWLASGTILNVASAAINGVVTILYENSNNYSYDSAIPTHFISKKTVTSAGVVSAASVVLRSLGLASKAFIIDGVVYVLGIYFSVFQPTYFLFDSSGHIVSRFAYENANNYYTVGLPSVSVSGHMASVGYFFKDLVQAVNKTQGVSSANGVYSQIGLNLVTFTLNNVTTSTAEIGSNLNLAGGFLWAYDGYSLVEQNFFLWPDNVEVTTAGTGGSITAQQYFYQVTYEWSDNQGNVFRSAPSIPVSVTTTGSTSANTINVPTLRLTKKVSNPVKIVVYRWSAAQQTYYQVTSVGVPTLNNTTVDSIAIVDTLADSAILGNNILYTTGGVVENIGPPATTVMTLYKSRLILVDAEDQNLLWYSKQVIEATPVEMSDLFTIYVAPTTSAQGNTGPITALSAMDDKLIIFKKDAIYYMTGTGPDNTGANNDFSDVVFVTSTVGCTNPSSIVFMPNGLMFQSDKGIWLLGRDLSTSYIGAPVEDFNAAIVQSSVNVPATNQVRFTLSTGQTLMYDYYYNQWGTFVGVPAISSTLFQSLHTFVNSFGHVFQENPGSFLDGTNPVLMSFITSWFNLAGLQGYERAYYFTLLGSFISPHKLTVQIAYDYAAGPSQQSVITPFNYNAPWGGDPTWGASTPWGGTSSLEQWKVHLQRQTCQAFQISINESFDSSYGTIAGAGFTLSGLTLSVGLKKGFRPLGQQRSVG